MRVGRKQDRAGAGKADDRVPAGAGAQAPYEQETRLNNEQRALRHAICSADTVHDHVNCRTCLEEDGGTALVALGQAGDQTTHAATPIGRVEQELDRTRPVLLGIDRVEGSRWTSA